MMISSEEGSELFRLTSLVVAVSRVVLGQVAISMLWIPSMLFWLKWKNGCHLLEYTLSLGGNTPDVSLL